MAKFIPENIETLLSRFKFDIDTDCINEDLACTICKKLLYDAYQSTCDCKYCCKCIVSYINDGNQYCPGGKEECREDLLVLDESVLSNALLNKKALKVRVRCPNESCQFTSTLTQMEDHLRVCSLQPMECPYTKIGCVNERVHRDSVENHLNIDMFAHSQMLMEVVDNLKNEVGALKDQMASLREECKLKEREIREERRMYQEVQELKREVAQLRGQVECAEENQQRLTQLKEDVEELKGELHIEREKSKKMMGEVETFKNDVEIEREESRKMNEEAAGIVDGRVGELTKMVDSLSKWINKGDAVGSLWFKVEGFNELWKKGGSIFSPHLYSHINGYKLRIQVNVPSSDGWLYVSSIICKGEYDDVLSWPARGLSVSVAVINHRTKEAYKIRTIKYDNQYCNKPIDKDKEPYGHIWWVSLSNLASIPGIVDFDCLLLLVTTSPP